MKPKPTHEVVNGLHLPTPPDKLTPDAFNRLCHYTEELRAIGMQDGELSCLFSDLYWDAVKQPSSPTPPT